MIGLYPRGREITGNNILLYIYDFRVRGEIKKLGQIFAQGDGLYLGAGDDSDIRF